MATNELKRGVPNGRCKKLEAELRTELIAAQERLQQVHFPTLIVLGGFAGAGTSEASNALRQWMDSHGIAVCAFESPSAEERERPEYWRYWLSLPPKGTIGIYLNGWYDRLLRDLAHGRSDEEAFKRYVGRITAFENELVVDGALQVVVVAANPVQLLQPYTVLADRLLSLVGQGVDLGLRLPVVCRRALLHREHLVDALVSGRRAGQQAKAARNYCDPVRFSCSKKVITHFAPHLPFFERSK